MTSAAANRFDLSGRVAWIVGGGGLLGVEASRALAEHGAHVVLAGRDERRLNAAIAALREDGLSADSAVVDVADAASVDTAVETILARHGRLDVCVNLAYASSGASFESMTAAQWEDGLRVTATGAFLVARAAGRAMRSGGSIIQFGSMYGMVSPDPAAYPEGVGVNPPDYGFAKAGVLQLVRYQAVQLASSGVRVNAITPGPFPGAGARAVAGFEDRLSARVPLGRVGAPREIGGAVVFLASDASSFVTGANIVVDGGWTAW